MNMQIFQTLFGTIGTADIVKNVGVENLSNFIAIGGKIGAVAASISVIIDYLRVNSIKWILYTEKEKASRIAAYILAISIFDYFIYAVIKTVGEYIVPYSFVYNVRGMGHLNIIAFLVLIALFALIVFIVLIVLGEVKASEIKFKKWSDLIKKTLIDLNIVPGLAIGIVVQVCLSVLPCVDVFSEKGYRATIYFSGIVSIIVMLLSFIEQIKSEGMIKVKIGDEELYYYFRDDTYLVFGSNQDPNSKGNKLKWKLISEFINENKLEVIAVGLSK